MGLPTFNFRTDLPSGYFDVYNLGMLRPKETPERVVFPPLNYIHIAMDFLRLRYTNKVSIKDHRIVGRGLKGRISIFGDFDIFVFYRLQTNAHYLTKYNVFSRQM